MINILEPDPENDPEEEAELTYRLQEAMHEFVPGPNGCAELVRRFCYEHQIVDYHNPCKAPSYSVLHYQDYTHDHGGRDCMCFEGEDY